MPEQAQFINWISPNPHAQKAVLFIGGAGVATDAMNVVNLPAVVETFSRVGAGGLAVAGVYQAVQWYRTRHHDDAPMGSL